MAPTDSVTLPEGLPRLPEGATFDADALLLLAAEAAGIVVGGGAALEKGAKLQNLLGSITRFR